MRDESQDSLTDDDMRAVSKRPAESLRSEDDSDSQSSEDEGEDGYKQGGYHPVRVSRARQQAMQLL